MREPLRIGTRGSQLALWQAERVQALLTEKLELPCELVRIKTTGDKDQLAPLSKIGGKGVFVKEIESALLAGDVDLAVHSTKDLTSELAAGTVMAAFPEREDPRDALVGSTLEALPEGATVGTGSLRRRCQLLARRPDLQMADIRGNVDTRVRKQREGEYDAVVLAAAGLRRLGLSEHVSEYLETAVMLPAVGQGIIGVQSMGGELADRIREAIDDPEVRLRATAERGFLSRFQGGCQIPIAAHATLTDGTLNLRALVVSLDGQTWVTANRGVSNPDVAQARVLGESIADVVLEDGAREILEEIARL